MNQDPDFQNFIKGLELHMKKTFFFLIQDSEAEELVVTSTLSTQKFLGPKGILDLTSETFEIKLKIPKPLNYRLIFQLSILSHWLPSYTKFELQEYLRNICTQNLNFYDLQIYLQDKNLCLGALFLDTHVNKRTLFGNILTGTYEVKQQNVGKVSISKYKLKISLRIKINSPAKRSDFKRGYNDHGSLPPVDVSIRKKENTITGKGLHWELERKRLESAIHLHQIKFGILLFLGTG